MPRGAESFAGAAICAVAALAISALASGHRWQVWVPLVFSAVLLLIALLFGSRAGVMGTVVATVIFAAFLFNPLRSIRVADAAARSNLGWMLLIGIGFSFLFAPPSSWLRRQ